MVALKPLKIFPSGRNISTQPFEDALLFLLKPLVRYLQYDLKNILTVMLRKRMRDKQILE